MKRVLYIAYYWPPAGGISVLRNLKFTKYFREFGWEPVIFSPKDANYPVNDPTTFKDLPEGAEIIRRPAYEPFALFNMLKGKKADEKVQDVFLVKDEKSGLVHEMGIWVRGNFFIPDARMLWIRPSVRYLKKYLREHPVDAMISYGPPHATHRIAYHLKKSLGIPWIADFQDPWTQIDYFEKFRLTSWARRAHQRQEQEVLKTADKVIMVSKSWVKDLADLGRREVEYIPFGYDEQDYFGVEPVKTDKFIISHFGTLGIDRNPQAMWQALKEIGQEQPAFLQDLQIVLAGVVDSSVFESIKREGFEPNLNYLNYLNKNEVIRWMLSSTILLLLLNRGFGDYNILGRIAAKLFEYLGSRRQILVIGPPEGDVANIVKESQAGITCSFDEKACCKTSVLKFYEAWKEGRQLYHPKDIEQYSFRNLTGKMAALLDEVSS